MIEPPDRPNRGPRVCGRRSGAARQERPGDARHCQGAEQLGISLDRLAKDLAVIRQAAALEGQAALADDPQLTAEIRAAYDEYVRYRDENERIFRDRKAEEQRLYTTWMATSGKRDAAKEARGRLSALLKKHWELFGRAEPDPEREPRVTQTVGIPQHDPEKDKAEAARLNQVRAFQNAGTTVRERETGRVTCVSGTIDRDRYEPLDANQEAKVLRQLERGEQPHLEG